MQKIIEIANKNKKIAFDIIKELNIQNKFKRINLVGSLKMDLLMKKRDIDFHAYSNPLKIIDSFDAIKEISNNKNIKKVTYNNLIDTDENCIEWHLYYKDKENNIWNIDIIHILEGSYYDNYFENINNNIISMLDNDKKNTILKLKYETPDSMNIMGIEYYKAVLKYNIKTFDEFIKWRDKQIYSGIIEF